MGKIIEDTEAVRLKMVAYYNCLSVENQTQFYTMFQSNDKAYIELIRHLKWTREELVKTIKP